MLATLRDLDRGLEGVKCCCTICASESFQMILIQQVWRVYSAARDTHDSTPGRNPPSTYRGREECQIFVQSFMMYWSLNFITETIDKRRLTQKVDEERPAIRTRQWVTHPPRPWVNWQISAHNVEWTWSLAAWEGFPFPVCWMTSPFLRNKINCILPTRNEEARFVLTPFTPADGGMMISFFRGHDF